ncbi:MAG TPA: hypothetical protein VMY76_02150 [Gemmatimonadales bacterium]|nr:hypothetical protein [Gemmatimonadales bacterium]
MHHPPACTVALTGLAALLTLACSDTAETTRPSLDADAAAAASGPTLEAQQSGTTNSLVGISAVSRLVAWASGANGTYTVTRDGGKTWHAGVVPGAEKLPFRDVEAVSAQEAYLLSIGPGEDSRIYHTVDGGGTWQLQFKNHDPAGFYDCFAFWSPDRGIVMADAIGDRFPVRRTRNGRFWNDIGDNLPAAQAGEAAFASSGTCVATQGQENAWIVTGGAEKARVLATTDGGNTWRSYNTPVEQGTPASGIFSVAFRDALHGVIAAGAIVEHPEVRNRNFAVSSDGGKTWKRVSNAPLPGAIYGLSYTAGHDRGPFNRGVVVTGPGGAAWSPNEGETWTKLPGVTNYWAVAFASPEVGWLVGTEGRILKITF